MSKYSNPYERYLANFGGRKAAINAMCAHCMGCGTDYVEPGFRNLIRDCSSVECPLWKFRPYKDICAKNGQLEAADDF